MNILVVSGGGLRNDAAVRAGRSLAMWSDGQCHVRTRVDADSIARRIERDRIDLIVTGAVRSADADSSGLTPDDLITASGKAVLVVSDWLDLPPWRFVIVSESHDLNRAVLQPAVEWLAKLPGRTTHDRPVRADLVHVIRRGAAWGDESAGIVPQLQQCLEQSHVIFSSARPAHASHLPESLDALRPDMLVVFQDVNAEDGTPALGRLGRRIVERSSRPVLLLPPGPRFAEHATSSELIMSV